MTAPDHKAVTRFALIGGEAIGDPLDFGEREDGDYVRFDDYEKLRQRCEFAETWLRRVVEAHTGENVDGCDMRNSEIAAIDRAGGGESLVEIVGGEEG